MTSTTRALSLMPRSAHRATLLLGFVVVEQLVGARQHDGALGLRLRRLNGGAKDGNFGVLDALDDAGWKSLDDHALDDVRAREKRLW